MNAKFRKEYIGSHWTPDQGEIIETIYRLKEFVSEPQVTMVPVSPPTIIESGPVSGPVSNFQNFRRLIIPKPRVRKAKEQPAATPGKTRKVRSDKGKHQPYFGARGIAPRKSGESLAEEVIRQGREGEAGNPEKSVPIGRTQEHKRLEFCNACGKEGVEMTFKLDATTSMPEHWVASCPNCGAAVCIANKHWDDMAEIK